MKPISVIIRVIVYFTGLLYSLQGLFKARSFLSSDYGSIFVNFSKPISLHQFCVSKGISRIPHGVQPR